MAALVKVFPVPGSGRSFPGGATDRNPLNSTFLPRVCPSGLILPESDVILGWNNMWKHVERHP